MINKNNEFFHKNQFINEAVTAVLFNNGTITGKEACELLSTPRRVFEEDILPKYGFTTMRNNSSNAKIELKATSW
jgi:hypothetical protein